MLLASLRERFGGRGVRFGRGPGGLPLVRVEGGFGWVLVSLDGAQVLDYRTGAGEVVLWRSRRAVFERGRAIRGGVPICWPWFGEGEAGRPFHGLARICRWELLEVGIGEDGVGRLVFGLGDSVWSRSIWGFRFGLRFVVVVGREGLSVELRSRNLDGRRMVTSGALHSYFWVGSVEEAGVFGLDGVWYLDRLAGMMRRRQWGAVRFFGEVDRVYVGAPRRTVLERGDGRVVVVESWGSGSTVVWNPWAEKARRLSDFGDGEYREMVCVETGNVGPDGVVLEPGEEHVLGARISLQNSACALP